MATATATSTSERVELAKHCSSRNWSKAIRVLDSLLAKQCSILDICNRAFCYNQLELHKHVIKDCDKALQLEPSAIQAYILKALDCKGIAREEHLLLPIDHKFMKMMRFEEERRQRREVSCCPIVKQM